MKEITLEGLIPVTSYSITVSAYQDILGPPSKLLTVPTTNNVTCISEYIIHVHACTFPYKNVNFVPTLDKP